MNISSSQVNKAGSRIRKFLRGELEDRAQLDHAIRVIEAFRAAHQYPLVKANNGLRSMISTERCQVEVSQRMKRFMTILDKLHREPTLALSRMQDVGGCRAILSSVDEIRRVEARLRKRRPVVGYSDYISNPRASGYRGVHVVVEYDSRCIEIQLRTRLMHLWAITVERQSALIGENLKQDGSHDVQQFMAAMSEAMALDESGQAIPQTLLASIQDLRLRADPYLAKGTV
ncbi:RelA/SpoT domain-containing protein [Microbacterium oleivorans]|uniref:RelA/SpoT domain-containing protein n=1 Tax=Microbacterium oleivorans TaxID=273677 RepID=UPI00080DC3BC|nr:RelA/SpoT domain-containing protein [Microbacterium oleivorans]